MFQLPYIKRLGILPATPKKASLKVFKVWAPVHPHPFFQVSTLIKLVWTSKCVPALVDRIKIGIQIRSTCAKTGMRSPFARHAF
jgi:hypothetical protein